MKYLILLSVLVFSSLNASAAPKALTSHQAYARVLAAANKYIANNAEDFGGKVKNPCAATLKGDQYEVVCTGVAHETIAGDGSVDIKFFCVGDFIQGHDGNFYAQGKIDCNDDASPE